MIYLHDSADQWNCRILPHNEFFVFLWCVTLQKSSHTDQSSTIPLGQPSLKCVAHQYSYVGAGRLLHCRNPGVCQHITLMGAGWISISLTSILAENATKLESKISNPAVRSLPLDIGNRLGLVPAMSTRKVELDSPRLSLPYPNGERLTNCVWNSWATFELEKTTHISSFSPGTMHSSCSAKSYRNRSYLDQTLSSTMLLGNNWATKSTLWHHRIRPTLTGGNTTIVQKYLDNWTWGGQHRGPAWIVLSLHSLV